jgi:amidase
MDDVTWLDATAQADLVRTGEVSPTELVDAAIARVEAVNAQLGAVLWPDYDKARERAAGDLPDGPFRGVPTLLKDIGAMVAGERTSFGLGPMAEVRWPVTSFLAEAFQAAGLVSLGRSTAPELGTTITTEPRSFPPARNPWNPEHSTGGSSGGSAAAVAAGLVPIAHANDGGGSIRVPAAECGLVGLKPTRARVSQGPLVGEGWAGGTIDGVVSRSVRDTAAALDAISGPMPGEPYYAPPLPGPLAAEVGADPGRLRIGLVEQSTLDGSMNDPECAAAVAATGRLLESLGHHVEPGGPDALFEPDFLRYFTTIVAADVNALLTAFGLALGREITDDEIEPRNAAYRHIGGTMPALTYLEARSWIGLWCRRMAPWWLGHDLLVTPTVGSPPPKLGWFTEAGPEQEGARVVGFLTYTAQFNMTGQPAVSLPLHWTEDGLPVGVQLVAPYGREDMLIRIASQLEEAAPWADRRPMVHG